MAMDMEVIHKKCTFLWHAPLHIAVLEALYDICYRPLFAACITTDPVCSAKLGNVESWVSVTHMLTTVQLKAGVTDKTYILGIECNEK